MYYYLAFKTFARAWRAFESIFSYSLKSTNKIIAPVAKHNFFEKVVKCFVIIKGLNVQTFFFVSNIYRKQKLLANILDRYKWDKKSIGN